MINDIYTLPKAAEKLEVNERFLRNHISDGTLKGYKVGRRLYVTHNDLVAFIESGKEGKDEKDSAEEVAQTAKEAQANNPTKQNKPVNQPINKAKPKP